MTQLARDLMGKVKQHNLRRHSNSLKPLKMVKQVTPDNSKKSRRVEGIKEKMIKKRPKSARKVKKKKSGWTSDTRVDCDWCKKSFSR